MISTMIKDNTNAVQSVVRKWLDGILGKFLLAQSCQQHGSTETHGNQTYEENQNIEVGILQMMLAWVLQALVV